MSNRERLLEGFLSDEPSEKLDIQLIAARVARMVSDPNALAHWRKMVGLAYKESEARHKVHDDWESQRDQFFRQYGKTNEPSGELQPPNDSVFELGSVVQVLAENKIESKRVWAWMPRHLSLEREPPKGVPLPLRWPLSVLDEYAVLAAIHDITLQGVDRINPWEAEGEVAPPYYEILLDEAKRLLQRDKVSLEEILARVEDDQRKWLMKDGGSRETKTCNKEQTGKIVQPGAYQSDDLFDKAAAERCLAQEKASKVAESKRQRQQAQARSEALRDLFQAAFVCAEKLDADLTDKDARQELARSIVAVSQELKARGAAQALDRLPTEGTPDTSHYLPLRFALRLFRLGRDKTADDVAADLERLKDHPNLRKYYDWFGGLSDVFCGPVPHFGGGIYTPAVLPLPVDNCTWEADREVMRALGLLPQSAPKSNLTPEQHDGSNDAEPGEKRNPSTVEQLRDAIQDILFFSAHPGYEDACVSADAALQTIKAANIAPPSHQKEKWLHQLKVDAFKLCGHIKARRLASDELCRLQAAMKERQDELWPLSQAHAPLQSDISVYLQAAVEETKSQSFTEWAGGPHVTLAIVFTDVVGSTAINEEVGDEQMTSIRRAHFTQGREFLKQFRGREIKTIGDSFMASFHSVVDALDFAMALSAKTGHERVKIRAGVHIGQVQVEGEDTFGGTVNFAARVEHAIQGQGIWISDRAKQDIDQHRASRHQRLKWMQHDGQHLKGIEGQFRLWELMDPSC